MDPTLKTIVFVHGLGESGASFREALEAPALDDYNVLIPDLAGFGRSSSAGADGYAFAPQIERLYRLLDHLEIDKFLLVGH